MVRITPAVKNLLIINVLCFAAYYVFRSSLGINLNDILGLHYLTANSFGLWQLVTFMFMHANISHIFFNMFALWMFGTLIENVLGTKRFALFYMACGVGSGFIQELAVAVDIHPMMTTINELINNWDSQSFREFYGSQVVAVSQECQSLILKFQDNYNNLIATEPKAAASAARTFLMQYQEMYVDAQNTVGASGAVFGILLATGMIFPNMSMYIMFIPIPIKAKWIVLGYGVLELIGGINGMGYDNVAHWAHLGGMLFAFLLLKLWKIERYN